MESEITVNTILFIVSLIVPGVFFKRFYFQGQFSQQFGAGLFADRLITSIFWGICVQIISFLLFSRMLGFTFTEIKESVSKTYGDISHNTIPKQMNYTTMQYVLGYLFFTTFIASVLGALTHKFIRFFKIDLKFEALRFANHWNYYFKGEILSTKDFAGTPAGKVLSTQVDLIIDESGTENKLVSGFLTQYTLSSESGKLENIYLTSAKRFSKSTNTFKDIPGECFIVPYERVMNMNIRYNIQSRTPINWKTYIYWTITTISLLVLAFALVYPWFLHIRVINRILSSLSLGMAWLLAMSLITAPFQTGPNIQTLTLKNVLQALLAIGIIFGLALAFLGKLTPIWQSITN